MHNAFSSTVERVDRYLTDYLPRAVVHASVPLEIEAWEVPAGVEGRVGEPVSFAAMRERAVFEPVTSGAMWGRPWGTTWFIVRGVVPTEWRDPGRIELSLDLGFNGAKPGFQCEGLVRTLDGAAVKGLEPRNHSVPIDAVPGDSFAFYVEAAANPDLSGGDDFKSPGAFRATPLGDPLTSGDEPRYRLGGWEVRTVDTAVERLIREMTVLRGLAAELGETDPRRASILLGLDRAVSTLDPDRPGEDADRAREVIEPLLASPAVASAHRIVATGHAHIDSAWLWPSRETVRKVTRTFANVLALMDTDPDLVFTCSSAQHFAWVRDHDPLLFDRVRRRVAEGRFVPVGNMWVESDVNMPSGESLARQFLYGTRLFEAEFGSRSDVGWLPDSFGYPGSLPQVLRKAGLRWFFTQKMCWNDTNRMPHHSFTWEGIDGSRIFTHFPPDNTYSGDMRPTELARSVRNFADHGHATTSLMPFGYGDGGGGPTREMMTDARLQSDLEGSPRVAFGTARDFFVRAEDEYAHAPVWSGEMYLEFHRGIYTSQARTKHGNRRNEALLVEAELWCATASIRAGHEYPHDELDALWQDVLLLQFHDILPGSAIAWVHREAEATHQRVTVRLNEIIAEALDALTGAGETPIVINAAPFPRAGLPAFGGGVVDDGAAEADTATAAAVEVIEQSDGSFSLSSGALDVVIAADGTLRSLREVASGREMIPEGASAARLQVHVDAPAKWDAWELDRAALREPTDLVDGIARADKGALIVSHRYRSSTIEQRIDFAFGGEAVRITTRVDWRERRRLLKLAFPIDVHATEAAYETQFGHVRRPLHTNTSWDAAKYEVCAHRWVHVGEPGFGVAIVNDRVYGHDVTRDSVDGRLIATVRQSLLRAPTFPDPDADQGEHTFTSLIGPAPTPDTAVAWGSLLSHPPRRLAGEHPPKPLVSVVGDTSLVVSSVKLAADRSGDLIVRVYEHRGARTVAALRLDIDIEAGGVTECDLVESPVNGRSVESVVGRDVTVRLGAFEVLTLRIAPAAVEGAGS